MRVPTCLAVATTFGAAITFPSAAFAQTPLDATVFALDAPFRFEVSGAAPGTSDVTILAGGTVAFAYQTGDARHNVHFRDAQPTSCVRFDSSDVVPPLPSEPRRAGWSGSCTFATTGVYRYFCDAHPTLMTGSVTVVEAPVSPPPSPPGPPAPPPPGSPPPPAPDPGTPPPPPTGPPPAPAPGPVPSPPDTGSPAGGAPPTAAGPAARRLRLATTRRSARVRGSVEVVQPSSRLRVDVLVRRSALRRRGRGFARAARLARAGLPVGRVSFSVRLNPAARRALARRGRLALKVKIAVTARTGAVFTRARRLTIRAR